MSRAHRTNVMLGAVVAASVAIGGLAPARAGQGQSGRGAGQGLPPADALATNNAMNNPYRMLENWPRLGDIKPGAAIGIVPDGMGGVWLQHRSVPAIVHIDSSGNVVKRFEVTFSSSHGFCRDRDGNFWAVDSGPFNDGPDAAVKGNQVFKFGPEGRLLLTLGKAGRITSGPRHLHSADRLPGNARRRHPDRRRPLAASNERAAGRRPACVVLARREVHQGVRAARPEAR